MDDQQDPGTLAPAPTSEPDAGSSQAEPDKDAPAAKKKKSFGRELLTIVVAAAVLTLLVKAFIIQVYRIPSASMENTLDVGDRVLVNKVVYHFRGIARGDVVVFSGQDSWGPEAPPPSSNPVVRVFDDVLSGLGLHSDQTYYIKRVIGLPGVPDHLAAIAAARPAHPDNLPAGLAARGRRGCRRARGRPGRAGRRPGGGGGRDPRGPRAPAPQAPSALAL